MGESLDENLHEKVDQNLGLGIALDYKKQDIACNMDFASFHIERSLNLFVQMDKLRSLGKMTSYNLGNTLVEVVALVAELM